MNNVLIAIGLLVFAPIAVAQDNTIYLFEQGPGSLYISGGGGVAGVFNDDWSLHPTQSTGILEQPSSSLPAVGTVNAAFGYEFDALPVRLELAYRWLDTAEYTWDYLFQASAAQTALGKVDTQAGLFNLYIDWRNTTKLTPFVGGGIGFYYNRAHFVRDYPAGSGQPITTTSAVHNSSGLAWGVSAGFRYVIGPQWLFDLRADYLNLGDVDFYTIHPDTAVTPGKQALMQTERFAAISGLVSLTYTYALDQY